MSERDYARKKNKWLPKIKAWIDEHHPGDILIPFSGVLEAELSALETPEQRNQVLASVQTKYELPLPMSSILPKIIVAGYNALSLVYFFTGGPDEVRCWTIRKNTKAPQAAGTIHTDFEKVFSFLKKLIYRPLSWLKS